MTTAMKKICTRCKRSLSLDVFNFKNKVQNKRHAWCRSCRNEQQMEHRRTPEGKARERGWRKALRRSNRQIIWDYLSTHPCVDCGEPDPIILQFDHLKDKKYTVCQMPWTNGADTIQQEIAKCEIRCANCHIRKTAKDFGHWKYLYDD